MNALTRLLLCLAVALVTTWARAETKNCADRGKIVERLESGYGERFVGGGLRNAQSIYEIWMNYETGTWTILMTRPDGTACVMAAGTNWREQLPDAPGTDG